MKARKLAYAILKGRLPQEALHTHIRNQMVAERIRVSEPRVRSIADRILSSVRVSIKGTV